MRDDYSNMVYSLSVSTNYSLIAYVFLILNKLHRIAQKYVSFFYKSLDGVSFDY